MKTKIILALAFIFAIFLIGKSVNKLAHYENLECGFTDPITKILTIDGEKYIVVQASSGGLSICKK